MKMLDLSELNADITKEESISRLNIEYKNEEDNRSNIYKLLNDEYGPIGWRVIRSGPKVGDISTGLLIVEINVSELHKKPYFCPLKKEYYFKCESGEQVHEIRPLNHHGWNLKNIYPGREITLSNGYGKQNRLTKTIKDIEVRDGLSMDSYENYVSEIPEWHIDAVKGIYPDAEQWLIAYL